MGWMESTARQFGGLGRAVLAAMVALALSLPAPALAWAAGETLEVGGIAAGDAAAQGANAARDADLDADVWDGSIDVAWYEDAPDADTYTLTKPAQLAGLAALVNGTSQAATQPLTFKGKTIKLGADIWLNAEAADGRDETGAQRSWTPIGDLELLSIDPNGSEGAMPHYADGRYFDGTLDGDGHVIKNLYIYNNIDGTYGGVQAFIANAGGNAVIRNVGIDDGWVYGRVAAGLVAISHATEEHVPHIVGCFNGADIVGNGSTTRGAAGIFAGEEQYRGEAQGQKANYHGGAFIANCYNTGSISRASTGSPSAGGIAGTGSVQMYGCYNMGMVDIPSRLAGSLGGCLIAPGLCVGQGSGAFEGASVVADSYALDGTIPADDQDLSKLYNMLDATHPKESVGEKNPGVVEAETSAFKSATWFVGEDATMALSRSYVHADGATGPKLYWEVGESQIDFAKKDDYGYQVYDISDIANQPYTGSPLKPKVKVSYNASESYSNPEYAFLHEGSDYVVAYANNIEQGTAEVTVTGVGRFYNEQSTTFSIIGSDLGEVSVDPIPAQWWYGEGTVNPAVNVYATNGDKLKPGIDYDVAIEGVPLAEEGFSDGKASATVRITSADETKFKGSKEVAFTVLQASTGLVDADADGYYDVGSKADLQYLAYATSQRVSVAEVEKWGARNFELTADVDARAHCDAGDKAYMTDRPVDPLFTYYFQPDAEAADQGRHGGFGGIFDGAGHTVTLGQTEEGLSLDPDSSLALFVYTKYQGEPTFRNLTIDGSLNAKNGVAAGLLVMAQRGTVTVENCTNNASCTSGLTLYGSAAGFIVETALSTDTTVVMRECTNNGDMTSVARAAGIVGALGCKTALLENCTNNATISGGLTSGAGGIVALVLGTADADSAYSEISFERCKNAGPVSTKSADAGGIVGWNQECVKQMTFARCANTGAVTYGGAGCNGAGIIGRAYSPTTIQNCYNNAKITPRNNANLPAGILGYAGVAVRQGQEYGDMVFRNVYSAGGFGSKAKEAGGIVGIVWLHNRITFDNCYYEVGTGCATKDIGLNTADDYPSAVAPPIIEGESVQMDSTSMKTGAFASLLGGAFASDEEGANGGYPVLTDSAATVFDLSVEGAYTVKGESTVAYTGAPIEIADLAVEDSAGIPLVEGSDYIVFYALDGTRGTAIIQGVGSYTGAIEKPFTLIPCDIKNCKGIQVRAISYAEVAGGSATQSFSAKSPDGTDMVEGVDYEVLYTNNRQPGQAYALVRGKAPYYTGSVTRPFTIEPGNLSEVELGNVDEHYPIVNGTGGLYIYESLTAPSGYTLERSDSASEKKDYVRVFFEFDEATGEYDLPVKADGSHDDGKPWANHLVKAGKYQVQLRGDGASVNPSSGAETQWTNGKWQGTANATFTYGNRMAGDEDVAVSGVDEIYGQTGADLRESIKPELTNKHTGYTLEEGTDYTLAYQVYDEFSGAYEAVDQSAGVSDAGSYKIIITGVGEWFGEREIGFQVASSAFFVSERAEVSGIDAEYFYTGDAVTPNPSKVAIAWGDGNVRTLQASDYSISYTDANGIAVQEPQAAGSYYVVITGKGAYKGSKRVKFDIVKPHMTVYQSRGDGEPVVMKRYTKAQFEALASERAADFPVSALYCSTNGTGWSVASSNNYVTLEDLLGDASVTWKQGASLTYAAGDFKSAGYSYEQLQSGLFYPATTADAIDPSYPKAAPFVLSITDASCAIGGASGTTTAYEAQESNLERVGADNAPRALFGVQESDYKNPQTNSESMRGMRLVKRVDAITVSLPENDMKVSARASLQSVTYNASKATSIAVSKLFSVSGAHGTVAYKKVSGNAAISLSSNGVLSVSKGLAVGRYPITVKVSDSGKDAYPAVTRTVSFTVQVTKAQNTLSAKAVAKGASVTYNAKKAQSIKIGKLAKVSGANGSLSYAKASGDKRIKVSKAGTVTLAKGLPVGTYKIKMSVKAAGDSSHKPKIASITVAVKVTKAANTLTVKAKSKAVTVAYSKSKERAVFPKAAYVITGAKGTVSFKKVSGSKILSVNAKTGKVVVKKGAARGLYKVKVKVRASGGKNYKAQAKYAIVTVKVK